MNNFKFGTNKLKKTIDFTKQKISLNERSVRKLPNEVTKAKQAHLKD